MTLPFGSKVPQPSATSEFATALCCMPDAPLLVDGDVLLFICATLHDLLTQFREEAQASHVCVACNAESVILDDEQDAMLPVGCHPGLDDEGEQL